MEKVTLNLPTMYGDHHVLEVRRLLLAMPGVADVYASSCFQVVEVSYDPATIQTQDIITALEESGYLQALAVAMETDTNAYKGEQTFFRHTAAYEQTKQTISFPQQIPYSGQPIWPCPGLGVKLNR